MAKRVRRRIGDILAIQLSDGNYSFARVLAEPLVSFYDRLSDQILPSEEILSLSVAFTIWVENSVITSGRWPIIGHHSIDNELAKEPKFFKVDSISGKISIYENGVEKAASDSEIDGLECAAVWGATHVEDRLRDYYEGVPNRWVESMRPQRSKD